MVSDMVQRPCNAGATESATPGSTLVQRPVNGGATHTPYPYGVAPAFQGGANAYRAAPVFSLTSPVVMRNGSDVHRHQLRYARTGPCAASQYA
jgi:hypothetical protein